ncbi:MAG: LamB/YcsF family protein [Bacteroidales bacterium]|nr:LamB/YcsF family protein [Bacteroidales bacterium]
MKVDINSDLGESFGAYKMGNDAEVMKYISSANIACGFHAGDPIVIEKTIKLALENHVAIGAHPGYPDLMGFGRRKINLSPEEVKAYVFYQVAALKAMTEALGGRLQHVKAHGALYNEAAENETVARAIAEAVLQLDSELIFVGLANSRMLEVAKNIGLKTVSEVFADRAYTNAGTLVPRSKSGSVIHNAELCNQRVIQMLLENTVEAIDGSKIQIKADTICIHGDNPAALELAYSLRKHLEKNSVEIQAMKA